MALDEVVTNLPKLKQAQSFHTCFIKFSWSHEPTFNYLQKSSGELEETQTTQLWLKYSCLTQLWLKYSCLTAKQITERAN